MKKKSINSDRDTQKFLKKSSEVASIFGGLAHPVRLRILCAWMEGEKTVSQLSDFCDLSQPSTSQFLARMKNEDLVTGRREGRQVLYSIKDAKMTTLLETAKKLFC